MNINLVLEILDLSISLAENLKNGTQTPAGASTAVLGIVQKGVQAYEEHTGKTLDPSLLHTEDAV